MPDKKNTNGDSLGDLEGDLEIDLDFSDRLSDGLSEESSGGFLELEDISDGSKLPFEDLVNDGMNDEAIAIPDFDETLPPGIEPINLHEDTKAFKVEELQMEAKDKIIDIVNVAQEESIHKSDNAGYDEEIIELVNVISDIGNNTNDDNEIIELVDKVEDSLVISDLQPLQQEEKLLTTKHESIDQIPSEDQIVALLEKVIANRYGDKIDKMFSQLIENVINKQIQDIKSKIINALRDVEIA